MKYFCKVICVLMALLVMLSFTACEFSISSSESVPTAAIESVDNKTGIKEDAKSVEAGDYSWLLEDNEPNETVDYTILMYINGTDLESRWGCATGDIEEMINSEFDSDAVNVLLLTGGTDKWHNKAVSKNTGIYQVKDGGLIRHVDLGNASIVDEGVLSSYVDYAMESFPAEKFGFVFWNHGGGTTGGYGSDELNDGASMSLTQINNAFGNTRMSDEPFEFIGFDCCLMATVETADIIQNYATYFIASEELEPGYGWDYNWLRDLSDNPKQSGEEIGKVIADRFVEFYAESGEEATLSVIKLSEIDYLKDCIETLAMDAQEAVKDGDFKTISKARKGTKTYGNGENPDEDGSSDHVDVHHLAQKLEKVSPENAADVMGAIEGAVVYSKASSNVENSHGLSTYLPYYDKDSAEYNLDVYESTGSMPEYLSFLGSYTKKLTGNKVSRSAISRAKPERDSSGEVSVKLDAETLEEINDITFTIWRQLEEDSDYFIKLGLDSDVEISDDGTIKTMFDGYWATLGGETACFYEIEKTEKYSKYYAPAVLNGETVNIVVTFDEKNPDGKIMGALPTDAKLAPRYTIPIQKGDKLAMRYFAQLFLADESKADQYDEKSMWINGEEFTVGDSLKTEIVPVGEELYMYGFWIEDINNDSYYTDFIEIRY